MAYYRHIFFACVLTHPGLCIQLLAWKDKYQLQGPPKPFFLENVLKKLLTIFSNFFFYLKIQSFRLIMENNFIQMAAWAGCAIF